MADLSELLGSILAGVAHARRVADEASASIAEAYRDEPLLEGMAVPRMRLPELVLDAPILIESYEEAEPPSLQDLEKVVSDLGGAFDRGEEQADVTLPRGFRDRFGRNLHRILGRGSTSSLRSGSASAEAVVRATDEAYSRTAKQMAQEYRAAVSREAERVIREELRAQARRSALKKIGSPPRLDVTLTTSQVKERANAKNVARLRLVIREEGVEWSVATQEDGAIKSTLTPE